MNIAIFQIDTRLHSYTTDFLSMCVEYGHSVTLYTTRGSDVGFVDVGDWPPDVLLVLDRRPLDMLFGKLWRIARRLTGRRLAAINPLLRRRAMQEAGSREHDLCIGIEKKGFIAAGWVSERLFRPLVYYSLELYVEGHPWEAQFRDLWKDERRFHRLADATIIQDRMRAAALLRANGVPSSARCLYLPVAVRRPTLTEPQFWLHERLGIDPGVRIVLYFGLLSRNRQCESILDAAAGLEDGYALVLHGPTAGDVRESRAPNVFLSTDLVPVAELEALVASAHFGISLYDNNVLNDRLTAFSSQKVAMYTRAGIPFIGPDNESYAALRSECACCELIDDISRLPEAVARISSRYESYSEQAAMAYERYFCLDKTFPPLIESLEGITARRGRDLPGRKR